MNRTQLIQGLIAISLVLLPTLSHSAIRPCSEVLQSTSQQWIKQYTKENGDNTLEQVKAILRYEFCYDDQLKVRKEKLDKSAKGPLMGAMGNFRDFETAFKEFTQLAIRPCGQTGDRVRIQRAYAYLYQLQFRHFFYLQYENPKQLPKTDPKAVKQQQEQLEQLLSKEEPHDAQLLRNRFNNFRQLAQNLAMPMQNVYAYAVMVLTKKGPIVISDEPF